MKPGRPTVQVPKGYKTGKARIDDYMDKAVILLDSDGTELFRGTRRECAAFSRARSGQFMPVDTKVRRQVRQV